MQHARLGQAHDDILSDAALNASIVKGVGDRLPSDLGMDTLSVCKFQPTVLHLITTSHCLSEVSGEEVAPLGPVEPDWALDCRLVGHDLPPELAHLLIRWLCEEGVPVEVIDGEDGSGLGRRRGRSHLLLLVLRGLVGTAVAAVIAVPTVVTIAAIIAAVATIALRLDNGEAGEDGSEN